MIHSRFREMKALKIVATGTGCLLATTAVFACVSSPSAAQTGAPPATSPVAAQVDDAATSPDWPKSQAVACIGVPYCPWKQLFSHYEHKTTEWESNPRKAIAYRSVAI